jgi:hypothetical protein
MEAWERWWGEPFQNRGAVREMSVAMVVGVLGRMPGGGAGPSQAAQAVAGHDATVPAIRRIMSPKHQARELALKGTLESVLQLSKLEGTEQSGDAREIEHLRDSLARVTQFAYAAAHSAVEESFQREAQESEAQKYRKQVMTHIPRLEAHLIAAKAEHADAAAQLVVVQPILKASLTELQRLRRELDAALLDKDAYQDLMKLVCSKVVNMDEKNHSVAEVTAALQILVSAANDPSHVTLMTRLYTVQGDVNIDRRSKATTEEVSHLKAALAALNGVQAMNSELNELNLELDNDIEVLRSQQVNSQNTCSEISGSKSEEMRMALSALDAMEARVDAHIRQH